MSAPRRYRLALLAYPRAYRVKRAPELLATLAEGDEERGRASLREAAALVRRGVAMRARRHGAADWLLAAAAVLPLIAVAGGFTWAEHRFVDSAILTLSPGWWGFAIGVAAYAVLAVLLFDALASPRRRRIAALLAVPVAFLVFTAPGNLFHEGIPPVTVVLDYAVSSVEAAFHNRGAFMPWCIAAVIATWLALEVLARLAPQIRRRALSLVLAGLAAATVTKSWMRPDVPAEYASSAVADLRTAALLTALAVPLALAALWPARRQQQL